MNQESDLPEELRFQKQEPPSLYEVMLATFVILVSILVGIPVLLFRTLQKERLVGGRTWEFLLVYLLVMYAVMDILYTLFEKLFD